jgi:hypothetical protein
MKRKFSPPQRDGDNVVCAASLLHVSEFDLFRLAYRNWYGRAPTEHQLASAFDGYLERTDIPMWVRAFVRQIQSLQAEDRLDPAHFGLRPRPAAGLRSGFIGAFALLVMLMIIALLVYWAELAQDITTLGCQLPPCY